MFLLNNGEYNIKDKFINKGSYGIVFKIYIPDEEKKSNNKILKKQTPEIQKEAALKINFKDKREKLYGISSLKELSILIQLLLENKDSQNNFNITKLIDFKEDKDLKKELYYKNLLNLFTDNEKDLKKKNHDQIHFIFDYYEYDLQKFCLINKITETIFNSIFEDLVTGLYWCYYNNICHRDLKPENILVSFKNDEYKNIFICDFGLSVFIKDENKNFMKTPGITTNYYRSPEVLLKNEYDIKIDYWSLGIILLNILTGNFLIKEFNLDNYENNKNKLTQEKIDKVINKYEKEIYEKEEFTKSFLTKYLSLIKKLLVIDSNKRYSLKEIVNEYFINKEELKRKKDIMKKIVKNKKDNEKKFILNNFSKEKKDLYDKNITISKLIDIKKDFLKYCLDIIKNKDKIEWYKNEIIYHSIYCFDKFLIECNKIFLNSSLKVNKKTIIGDEITNYKELYSKFFYPFFIENDFNKDLLNIKYIFVYIYFKFFIILFDLSWEKFCEVMNVKSEIVSKKLLEEIELFVFNRIFPFNIYCLTEYEILNKPIISNDNKNYLSNLEKYIYNEINELN